MDEKTLKLILDAFPFPIAFIDTGHIVRYLNKRAEYHYYQERGYKNLIGRSIFDCHNENSKEMILKAIEKLKNHNQEMFLLVNIRNERVYMTPSGTKTAS